MSGEELLVGYTRSASNPPNTTGVWRGVVTSVTESSFVFTIPRLSGALFSYETDASLISSSSLSVGDTLLVTFAEGRNDEIVVLGKVGGDAISDHGSLTGLSDDDHTQYLLADGTRDAAYIGFNTTSPVAVTEGQIAWNDDEGTIDIGMHGGNVVLQSGQEVVYYVKNQTGSDIPDGTVVRFDGSFGSSGRLKVAPFLGDKTYTSAYIMGITTETIPDGEDGYVTHFGKVRGLDTTTDSEGNTLVDGDLLYASATVVGGYTKNEPAAPNNRVLLAAVVHAHAHQGTLFVRPTFVTDLLENERVNAPTISDNDVLVYNGTTGVFENEQFDHGGLSGLSDDDHTQYLLVDGSRSAESLVVGSGANITGHYTGWIKIGASNTISLGIDRNSIQAFNDTAGTYNLLDINSFGGNVILNRDAGNVGIGTVNPTSKLDVIGDVEISGSITVNPDGANPFTFPTSDGASGQTLTTDGAGSVTWQAPSSTPVGTVIDWVGPSSGLTNLATEGWLSCDGSSVSRTTYADLFALLGTTYGSGDGSTTFGLPDLRQRVTVGLGTGAAFDTVGETGGTADATLVLHDHSISHDHPSTTTASDDHSHTFALYGSASLDGTGGQNVVSADGGNLGNFFGNKTTSVNSHSHTVNLPNYSGTSGSAGSTATDKNYQPYMVVYKLIKAW